MKLRLMSISRLKLLIRKHLLSRRRNNCLKMKVISKEVYNQGFNMNSQSICGNRVPDRPSHNTTIVIVLPDLADNVKIAPSTPARTSYQKHNLQACHNNSARISD